LAKTKVVALGGITNKNRKKLKLLNCFGFAGISYFE
jgi:thiamine-phosphate pyrophosphorylase